MVKIDLHTHSIASPDGGISLHQYSDMLATKLDYIAITDHNRIDFALEARHNLGDKIIVGEEIMTQDGEIIGLYLSKKIKPFQSLGNTIRLIKQQKGLVYVPHPFETIRHGIPVAKLTPHIDSLDIIEVINGRAMLGDKSQQATNFANKHGLSGAVSSDSHGFHGWGVTYSITKQSPSRDNLANLLQKSDFVYKKPHIRALLYPKYNRIKKAVS